ncbi:MAG: hypothetical protein HC804_03905 [Anaerolineae bacterium]|nr:hypothetical protein [Anaerolineae bacterium]
MFFAILGVIAIWGAIDGVMYALTEVFQRGERHRLLQYVQTADKEETAVDAIADELDFILEPITNEDQRYNLYHDILAHLRQAEPQDVGLQREDVVGGLTSVLVSVIVVLPSLMPLLLLPKIRRWLSKSPMSYRLSLFWHRLFLGQTYRYQSVENGLAPGVYLLGYGSGCCATRW